MNGYEKKQMLISQEFRRLDGEPDVDDIIETYEKDWNPTGISRKDHQIRRQTIRSCIKAFAKTYIPSNSGPFSFRPDNYLSRINDTVPAIAFNWNRREKIDAERLADFVGVKVQDAFFKKDRYIAQASRNATLANFRTLKDKGLVDWVCGPHQYTKLLEIACQYDLLIVHEQHIPPMRNRNGEVWRKGCARVIGPGPALPLEYEAFQPIWDSIRVPNDLLALVA